MELYPFQQDLVAEIERRLESVNRICTQLATGGGKTVLASELIKRAVAGRDPVLFIAHRLELIEQASRKLIAFGIPHGIIKAGFNMRLHHLVQVASIQTLFARAIRNQKIGLPRARWVFVDEAHHVRAETYMQVVAAYPAAHIVGLTATPCRADGRGLGNVFEVLVEGPTVAELIRGKYLVPAKVFAPVRPDLTGVRVQRGDYVEADLAARVDTAQLRGGIIDHWFRLGEGRPTVVFTVNVAHSRHLCDEFAKAGVAAAHVDGTTPLDGRRRILKDLVSGKINIVCNCMVLVEGWDCPEASCAILARPTKSLSLYRQIIGRVLRTAPEKSDAIVLDHAGAVFAHGLPDDEIQWTLDKDERAANRTHQSRGHDSPTLTTCPQCQAIRLEGKPCIQCGWQPKPPARPLIVADGELSHVKRNGITLTAQQTDWSIPEQLAFYRMLRAIECQKAYKPGWAAHKFKERFGRFPPWSWNNAEPLQPSRAVAAWVRSRQIAYAMAHR